MIFMGITFKQYIETDFNDLALCMERLQDFIVGIDSLKRLHKPPTFGKKYTTNLVKDVTKQNGLIILAYDGKKIIGCIAGFIEKQTKRDLIECIPTTVGRIPELFVSEQYRGNDIGKKLMQRMEAYFKKNNCDVIRINVFAYNKNAQKFYQKLDYSDRVVNMIKVIK